MAFNVFTNAEQQAVIPDAIITPSGMILTNYDLSPDAAKPQNIGWQPPTSRAYQLSEIPFTAMPALGTLSWLTGRGFYYPRDRRAVVPGKEISLINADLLSTKIASETLDRIVAPYEKSHFAPLNIAGAGTPTDLQTILSRYRVSAQTIALANQQTPGKFRAMLKAYQAAVQEQGGGPIGRLIGGIYMAVLGVIASLATGPVGASAYASMQGGLNLGYASSLGKNITWKDVAIAEGPAVAAGALPFLEPASEGSTLLSLRTVPEGTAAAQLGLTAPALETSSAFAPTVSSTFSTASSVASSAELANTTYRTAQEVTQWGPLAATKGPGLISDLTGGKIGSFFSDIGRAFGIPIPKAPGDTAGAVLLQNQPQPPQPAGSLNGGSMLDFTPANPLTENYGQWIIGAGLLLLILFVVFRR